MTCLRLNQNIAEEQRQQDKSRDTIAKHGCLLECRHRDLARSAKQHYLVCERRRRNTMPLLPKRSGVEARLSRALRCGTTDDASSGAQTRSRTCVVIRASLLSQVAQRLSLR